MRGVFMSAKKVKTQREEKKASPIKTVLVFAAIGTVLFFVLLCVFAFVALKIDASVDTYSWYGFGSMVVSAFLSAFAALRKIKNSGIVFGALTGLLQGIVAAVASVAANSGTVGLNLAILVAVAGASAAVGGVLAVNKKTKVRV